MPSDFDIEFRIGTKVRKRDNPRHIGIVRAVFDTRTIRVKWDNGWISDADVSELEAA